MTSYYDYCKICFMLKKKKTKNQIILGSFAAAFSVVVFAGLMADKHIATVEAAQINESVVEGEVLNVQLDEALGEENLSQEAVTELIAVDETLEATGESSEETCGAVVTLYDSPLVMYASDTVNVRSGAGTDFAKLGRIAWGSELSVLGVTDNNWYEISYGDSVGFISGDYVTSEIPSVPYLFVGDSRTVQLEMAVGDSDKAYVAKVGEGYSWFKNTALTEIQEYAGNGTTMIINFGVNDLANASKYISLINSYIDVWDAAGITVYYSSVTPVGSYPTVTNAQIENFNSRLQSEFDPRIKWIDSYSYLTQTGFNTADGLHYDKSTYQNLYSYYMSVVATDV